MGQQSTKLIQWKVVQNTQNHKLLKSILSNQLIQQHLLVFNNINIYHKQLFILQNRLRNQKHIPHIKLFKQSNNLSLCNCDSTFQILVYMQYIPFKLYNVKQIKYGTLQLLKIIIFTLQILNKKFQINQSMIGFTQKKKPKIWYNQDFSNSLTKDEEEGLQCKVNQNQMIQSILKMIYSISNQNIPQYLLNCLNSKNKTFVEILDNMRQIEINEQLICLKLDLNQKKKQKATINKNKEQKFSKQKVNKQMPNKYKDTNKKKNSNNQRYNDSTNKKFLFEKEIPQNNISSHNIKTGSQHKTLSSKFNSQIFENQSIKIKKILTVPKRSSKTLMQTKSIKYNKFQNQLELKNLNIKFCDNFKQKQRRFKIN